MSKNISAWLMVVCATLLLMVGEILLAAIFGVVAVLMFSNNKKAPAKESTPKKTNPAVKTTTAKNPPVQKTSAHRQTSPVEKQDFVNPATAPDAYAFRGTVEQYFRNLLETNFPDYQVAQNASLNKGASQSTGWTCSCGSHNTGKFCVECGSAKPAESTGWTCSCGSHNTGKFCAECGSAKPAESTDRICSYGQKDTGTFCPECSSSKPATQAVVASVGTAAPLTFLLSKNGAPKLGILLCDKYLWNTEQIQATMADCKTAKIPCLRFMREFRNDANYVTDRIRKSLR